jgi:GTP pyrophosphokinase
MLTPRITDAFAYAFSVQGQQTRKGTAVPYMAHLMGVTALVLHYGGTETEAIGALLHDAAEDGGGHPRLADIHTHFGPDVARIVDGCSDSFDTPKRPWLERKKAYVARVPDEPASVILVSAADKIHNVTSIINDYRHHGETLWTRFNKDAGKAGTVGYYRGLVTAYRANGHHPQVITDLDEHVTTLETLCDTRGEWPPQR